MIGVGWSGCADECLIPGMIQTRLPPTRAVSGGDEALEVAKLVRGPCWGQVSPNAVPDGATPGETCPRRSSGSGLTWGLEPRHRPGRDLTLPSAELCTPFAHHVAPSVALKAFLAELSTEHLAESRRRVARHAVPAHPLAIVANVVGRTASWRRIIAHVGDSNDAMPAIAPCRIEHSPDCPQASQRQGRETP